MEAQNLISKRRWTASRLFWTGLGGFFASLVGVFLAVVLWWRLAFDWQPDENLAPPYPIPAYLDMGLGILSIVVGVLSIGLMIASGIKAALFHGKSAA